MAEPADEAMLPALRNDPDRVSSVLDELSLAGSSCEWRFVWIVPFSVDKSCKNDVTNEDK